MFCPYLRRAAKNKLGIPTDKPNIGDRKVTGEDCMGYDLHVIGPGVD